MLGVVNLTLPPIIILITAFKTQNSRSLARVDSWHHIETPQSVVSRSLSLSLSANALKMQSLATSHRLAASRRRPSLSPAAAVSARNPTSRHFVQTPRCCSIQSQSLGPLLSLSLYVSYIVWIDICTCLFETSFGLSLFYFLWKCGKMIQFEFFSRKKT